MATDELNHTGKSKRIVIIKNGPYKVEGDIPLVNKTQIVSEHGEPLTWQKTGTLEVSPGEYYLCRCGRSSRKPFCDGTHRKIGFEGTETADTGPDGMRRLRFPRSTGIVVEKESSLCMLAGFCGFSDGSLKQLVASTTDTRIRSLVIAMVERCPSGSLTYRIEEHGPDIEPDLPPQIAVTTEITSDGPIAGPLWVTGGVPVERSDGQPFEPRNRLTLCNCGNSCNKPLCDGTHREAQKRG